MDENKKVDKGSEDGFDVETNDMDATKPKKRGRKKKRAVDDGKSKDIDKEKNDKSIMKTQKDNNKKVKYEIIQSVQRSVIRFIYNIDNNFSLF